MRYGPARLGVQFRSLRPSEALASGLRPLGGCVSRVLICFGAPTHPASLRTNAEGPEGSVGL